jgi:lipopolysaccharide export system protein LptA
VTAERADYDQKNEILTLTGKVMLDDSDGNHFEIEKAILYLKEGEDRIKLFGGTGNFHYREGEEEPPPSGTGRN